MSRADLITHRPLPDVSWPWKATLALRRSAMHAVLPLIPDRITLPIISGPARGMLWRRDACNSCFWLGTYERPKCEALIREMRPTDVFYDIGANSGYYSLIAATRCRKVIAFEPFPRNIARFRANVKLNKLGNVSLVDSALSDRVETMKFAEGRDTESGRLSTSGSFEVKVTSIDTFTCEAPPPDIIKMDIEGGELLALAGSEKTLQRYRPLVFLATHGEAIHLRCVEMLKSLDYEITLLQHDEIIAKPPERCHH
jgi:FkbM family methyltransferase